LEVIEKAVEFDLNGLAVCDGPGRVLLRATMFCAEATLPKELPGVYDPDDNLMPRRIIEQDNHLTPLQ
jgi:hypothetical protein